MKCYNIYIDDYLSSLCQAIRYEQQDMKRISILLQISKNFNSLSDSVSVSRVFDKIFDSRCKTEIFSKLHKDAGDNIFYNVGSRRIMID